MYTINEDLSIYATRGDIVAFAVTADDKGTNHKFQPGDVVRIKIYGKKNAENVVLQKDFPVFEETEQVDIYLSEHDTKFGEVISKPTDYWYEVELNPFTDPQTIIGYDEDGAKVFKLFPEGNDIPEAPVDPEVVKVIDDALDLTSSRPVMNRAVARAITQLNATIEGTNATMMERTNTMSGNINALDSEIGVERARVDNLIASAVAPVDADANYLEVADIRVGADGMTHASAGASVRVQVERLRNDIRGIVEDGNPSMNAFVNWVLGGVTSGAVVPTMGNRIATNNILKFNRDVTLLIDSGYRMGVHLLDEDGNFVKDSGWKTSEYPVPKNTPFRVVIARVDETNDRADIHKFSSALSIEDYSAAQVRDLHDTINSIDKTFALEQFPGTEPFNQVMYVDIRNGEFELTPSFYCTVNLGYADGTEEHISDGVIENETFTFTLTRPIKYIRCFAQSVPLNVHLRAVNRFTKTEDSVAENTANVARIEKEIAALGRSARKKSWLSSAHRGFVDSVLKENCLAAYYNAYLNGADMIETDARLSSDGVLIVNHDPTVTGINENGETVTYTVAETPASKICALILCADDKWGTQYVPTLAQVLRLAYNTGLIVNIDLKDGTRSAEAVAKIVFAYGMQGRVIYALNGAGMAGMSKILAIDPDARFIDMVGRYYGAEDYAERGKRCFAYTSDISTASVNAIREKGFMLALTSLHSGNFVAAVGYSPDMCEYLHTSDFRAIEDAYFADLKLY